MTYTSDEGRRELLGATAEAADTIGVALAALGAAYESPVSTTTRRSGWSRSSSAPSQATYGRAKRSHAEFAARHGLAANVFGVAALAAGALPLDAAGYVEQAIEATEHADDILSELQDSMLPVEVGDPELRAAIADVRTRLGEVPGRAADLLRTLGR